MKKYKTTTLLVIVLIVIAGLYFQNSNTEEAIIEPATTNTEKDQLVDIPFKPTLEGVLIKDGEKFYLMNWELRGDTKELESMVGRTIVAKGVQEGENEVLKVSDLQFMGE